MPASDRELERLEQQVDGALREVREVREIVQRLLAIEEGQAQPRAELRESLRAIQAAQQTQGERLARVEATLAAEASAVAREERAAAWWASLAAATIGPDGYLRSRAFLVALGLLGLALGAVTAEQLAGWWMGLAPVLVPVPTPP